tara:strand:+ start:1074 stop:2132 length:1059 start_codon:yes stop_codon:yes gene_type:complete
MAKPKYYADDKAILDEMIRLEKQKQKAQAEGAMGVASLGLDAMGMYGLGAMAKMPKAVDPSKIKYQIEQIAFYNDRLDSLNKMLEAHTRLTTPSFHEMSDLAQKYGIEKVLRDPTNPTKVSNLARYGEKDVLGNFIPKSTGYGPSVFTKDDFTDEALKFALQKSRQAGDQNYLYHNQEIVNIAKEHPELSQYFLNRPYNPNQSIPQDAFDFGNEINALQIKDRIDVTKGEIRRARQRLEEMYPNHRADPEIQRMTMEAEDQIVNKKLKAKGFTDTDLGSPVGSQGLGTVMIPYAGGADMMYNAYQEYTQAQKNLEDIMKKATPEQRAEFEKTMREQRVESLDSAIDSYSGDF